MNLLRNLPHFPKGTIQAALDEDPEYRLENSKYNIVAAAIDHENKIQTVIVPGQYMKAGATINYRVDGWCVMGALWLPHTGGYVVTEFANFDTKEEAQAAEPVMREMLEIRASNHGSKP